VVVAIRGRALVEAALDRLQRLGDRRDELRAGDALLVLRRAIAPRCEHGILVEVARSDLEPHGHALAYPVPDLLAAALVALVDGRAHGGTFVTLRAQLGCDVTAILEHAALLVVGAIDRNDDHLLRREPRRQHEAVVVGVRHEQAAYEPRRDAPARRPRVLLRAVGTQKLNVARASEILAQEMARARLQRFAVLHHRFDRERAV